MMRFVDPFFIGYEHFKEFDDSYESENSDFVKDKSQNEIIAETDLYVSVSLVKPGKQYYLIAQNKRVFNKEDRDFV